MAEVGDGIDLYADVEDFGQVFNQFLYYKHMNMNFLFVEGLQEVDLYCKATKSVADPGFSPGGRQLPKMLLFFNFLPKTA